MPLIIMAFAILFSQNIEAYPYMIGYGYGSCINCHYNPFGNGPLTDYGRAVGATTLTARTFYDAKTSDEALAEKSGFLYSQPSQDWFRPQVNYRGLNFTSNQGTDQAAAKDITMMLNASGVFKFGEDDNVLVVLEAGYAPSPAGIEEDDEPNYRSRENYVGYRLPEQNYGFYVGLMDKVFGIRVPDHNLYSRSVPQLTMNDQAHSALFHAFSETWELGLQYFIGNLSQEEELRQQGFTGKAEYSFDKKTRAGVSYLSSENDYLKLNSYALEFRQGFGTGSAIMAEYGMVTQEIISSEVETSSQYFTTQSYVRLNRGIHFVYTYEYLKNDIEEYDHLYRMGPGFQWFPLLGVELRVDIYNKKGFSEVATIEDSWDLAGQVHLWF
ncbi:hypothetical protein N9N67_02140 [Bacteriovoracaceae bacterium]|nr:hypothetical protein [Bacteriovoracaceae bacterium]